jgi:hypothetical protein
MKRGFQINILLLLLFYSFQLSAQQQNAATQPIHTRKLELKLSGDMQAPDLIKIDQAFAGYTNRIISHEYSTVRNRLFVFISNETDPVDVLQILKMNNIKAAYRDDDNGYVTLEPDGRTTRKLYFKE